MLISQSSRFAELQSRIDGQVLMAGDDAWDASRQTFNLTHDQQPAALVRVASADDVVEAVRYAAKHGLRIAPQSTGHNAGPIEGLEDALLVRTDDLQEISIDVAARRARVGSGVRWGEVADRASAAGLAPLSGSSRDVGITGYSLGGGMGWLARKHGLQANALTAVEIVTADGELRRIDHDNETDLFWAVRGGGGNYGVVTALEFELFPAPEIYAGSLFFPYERAAEVMHAWHDFVAAGLPDEITTVARRHPVPAARGDPGDAPRQVVHDPPGRLPRQRGGRRRADPPAHGPRSGDEHVRHGRAERARLPRHGPRAPDAVRGLVAACVAT